MQDGGNTGEQPGSFVLGNANDLQKHSRQDIEKEETNEMREGVGRGGRGVRGCHGRPHAVVEDEKV